MRRISTCIPLGRVSLLFVAVLIPVIAGVVVRHFGHRPDGSPHQGTQAAVDPTNPHGFISIGVIDPHMEPRATELLTKHGIDSAIDGSVVYDVAVRPEDALRATALLKSDPRTSLAFVSTLR